jgi:hypothetical protein
LQEAHKTGHKLHLYAHHSRSASAGKDAGEGLTPVFPHHG